MSKDNLGANRSMSDDELEKKLQPYVTKLSILSVIEIIGLVIIIGAVIMAFFIEWSIKTCIILVAGVAVLIVSALYSGKVKAQYDEIFKQELGPEIEAIISSYVGPQLNNEWDAVYKEISQEMRESHLVDDFDSVHPNSYRKGNYRGQIFEAFNANMTKTERVERHDSDQGTVYEDETRTVFQGTWLILDLKQEITSPVVIRNVKKKDRKNPYWNVKMENEMFNDHYCIHTDDEHLAYYILTPQFMELLLDFDNNSGGKCGYCFVGNKMLIAIEDGKKFLDMSDGSTKHIGDLKENLKNSLDHYTGLIGMLLNNSHLFGR